MARLLCHEPRLLGFARRDFQNGKQVAVFGAAGGTIAGTKWRTPAAWLAVVQDDLVKEWRVYADNKPVYDILAKSNPR